MWRIHFNSADDFAQVRLAKGADPMWEIVHSLQALPTDLGEIAFGAWRRAARTNGRGRWTPLCTLAPPFGYFPDFLTPIPGVTDPREGVELVLRTPREVLRDDLTALSGGGCLPAWATPLADGRVDSLRALGGRMAEYFRSALAPHWRTIRRTIDAELDRLGRQMTSGGVAGLLAHASDILSWSHPVLSLTNKVRDRDIYLNGRGLILQPSFFAYGDTTIVDVPPKPVVLAYPVGPPLDWLAGGTSASDAGLRSLLGGTRTDALEELANGSRTTTDLAACLGVSPATVSQHTKVLREAGLVRSEQRGKSVVHAASGIGVRLLEA